MKNLFKIFIRFTTWQTLLQVLNMTNGFLLVRWLEIEEQAKFSLFFSIQTFLVSILDLGYSNSIMALIGSNFTDKNLTGRYVNAALFLRKRFLWNIILCTTLFLPFLVQGKNWLWFEILLLYIPCLLAVTGQINQTLFGTLLILNRNIDKLYIPHILLSLGKLIVTYLLLYFSMLKGLSVLILNAIVYFITGSYFKRYAKKFFTLADNEIETEKSNILKYLKPLYPGLIFNSLFGQIQIFIISIFGKTQYMAEVAALGKLGQIFVFLSAMFSVIFAPIMAKTSQEQLPIRYFMLVTVAGIISTILYGIALILPEIYLFLLGPKYSQLKNEISLLFLSSGIGFIGSAIWTIHSVRNWLFAWGSWSYIGIVILCQIIGMLIFDIGSTEGVLKLSIFTSAGVLLNHFINGAYGFYIHYYKMNTKHEL